MSAPGDDVQVGLSRNQHWQVCVSRPTPNRIHVCATDHPDDPPTHPYATGPDTPARRALTNPHPLISLAADDAPNITVWKSLVHDPQLARVIATAIYRRQPLPWPS